MFGKEQAAENEACLEIAEEFAKRHAAATTDYERGMKDAAEAIAAGIRARFD